MTQAVIELDQDLEPQAETPAIEAMSFRAWWHAWAPEHPGAVIGLAGAVIVVAATIVGLAFLVLRPPAAQHVPLTQGPYHSFSIGAPDGADVQQTIVYRDISGDLVISGPDAAELIGKESVSLLNVAAVTVTVRAPQASCVIRVDDRVVSQAQADGSATCAWVSR
jgi:hypothetical protein